mmetsp:Transcript_102976/g.204375  ORF Transcript_102976/g.204375 Transcript_102976/m.204375 type:complete len:99 (+) Transcript_102976:56-352(+)
MVKLMVNTTWHSCVSGGSVEFLTELRRRNGAQVPQLKGIQKPRQVSDSCAKRSKCMRMLVEGESQRLRHPTPMFCSQSLKSLISEIVNNYRCVSIDVL